MAEVITDEVARRLGSRRRCQTRAFPLDGAPRQPWPPFTSATMAHLCSQQRLDETAARHLVYRYGRRATDVTAYVKRDPALAKPVIPGEPDLLAEFDYHRDHEMAIYPADFLLRRTRLGLFHPALLKTPLTEGMRT
jgi:glycerol-3-phosphate dehydrogenase